MALPESSVTSPRTVPAPAPLLALMVGTPSVPVVVMLTAPPLALALPAVLSAPTVALLPVRVMKPALPPAVVFAPAPACALMVLVPACLRL